MSRGGSEAEAEANRVNPRRSARRRREKEASALLPAYLRGGDDEKSAREETHSCGYLRRRRPDIGAHERKPTAFARQQCRKYLQSAFSAFSRAARLTWLAWRPA